MKKPIRIAIVDDHPMVAEGIEAILYTYDDLTVVGTLSNGQEAIDRVEELAPDVILLPGGSGARREIANPATVDWLQRVAPGCDWVTSVCTGAFLLLGSGLAKGRRITTHHDFLDDLRAMGGATVVEGQRFVRDGNVVSAGGVMSGIEMSLWLVRTLYGPEAEAHTRSYIAYAHPPRDAVPGG